MTPLPPLPPGVPSELVRYLQAMAERITAQRIIAGAGYGVDERIRGTALSIAPSLSRPGTPGEVRQYLVQSVSDDTLTCALLSGTTAQEGSVTIAKPHELRKTPWHGQTIAYHVERHDGRPDVDVSVTYSYFSGSYRTATIIGTVEHQTIIPRYIPGTTVIYAAKTTEALAVEDGVEFVDLNVGGRAWARIY